MEPDKTYEIMQAAAHRHGHEKLEAVQNEAYTWGLLSFWSGIALASLGLAGLAGNLALIPLAFGAAMTYCLYQFFERDREARRRRAALASHRS